MPHRISEQIRRNAVAIISLIVALTSLGYNTYRNELSEANRTVRQAGFEMIAELSELQQVMLFARYGNGDARGDTTAGWTHVLALRDLSVAMPANIQQRASHLYKTWQENNRGISSADDSAYTTVDKEIDHIKMVGIKKWIRSARGLKVIIGFGFFLN